jgi:hypothetical protein
LERRSFFEGVKDARKSVNESCAAMSERRVAARSASPGGWLIHDDDALLESSFVAPTECLGAGPR